MVVSKRIKQEIRLMDLQVSAVHVIAFTLATLMLLQATYGKPLPGYFDSLPIVSDGEVSPSEMQVKAKRWPSNEYAKGNAWWTKKSLTTHLQTEENEATVGKSMNEGCMQQMCNPVLDYCIRSTKTFIRECLILHKMCYERCMDVQEGLPGLSPQY